MRYPFKQHTVKQHDAWPNTPMKSLANYVLHILKVLGYKTKFAKINKAQSTFANDNISLTVQM